MKEDVCLSIIQSIVDSQKDLIIVFRHDEPILLNGSFKKFFSVASLEQYKSEFGSFVNNFVPHPSYFNADKIKKNSTWYESISELEQDERIVSMVTSTYEPHAFFVNINKVQEYIIVAFVDITQSLIKRIMIENKTNIDEKSGAYAKNYFLQIAQSYHDAALFNKKQIGAVLIQLDKEKNSDPKNENLKNIAASFKKIIRQDDMLIRWDDNDFLLIYLVESFQNAQIMNKKLDELFKKEEMQGIEHKTTLIVQNENESIKSFINRIKNS